MYSVYEMGPALPQLADFRRVVLTHALEHSATENGNEKRICLVRGFEPPKLCLVRGRWYRQLGHGGAMLRMRGDDIRV